ncbi:FtsX-like permease family protein [Thalassotalea marina]|uniref:FtsX-like permease family protein n=1 Tax=Thalassotalea marina TaxID=1673741 RepID=A0A919ENQ6_9GAMM|nr:FtsX-like permease family protein [Thalassotalea marina]GHG00454.1 hypothetical protein GCM10017161_31410 [Thalassotalea marina]
MSLYQRSFFTGIARIFTLPKLSIPLILTLGLTLGAVLTVFAISSSLLFKPLKGVSNEKLITSINYHLLIGDGLPQIAFMNFQRLSNVNEQYGDLGTWGAMTTSEQSISINDVSYATTDITASDTILEVLGAKLILGDNVTKLDPEGYIWISESLWHSVFSGLDNVIGKQVTINDQSKIIAGVIEDVMAINSSRPVLAQQIWHIQNLSKLKNQPEQPDVNGALKTILLKAKHKDVQLPSEEEFNSWMDDHIKNNLQGDGVTMFLNFLKNTGRQFKTQSYRESLIGESQPIIITLFCAVIGLLIMATLNLLNLFIAHYQGRTKEFAIQLSLGASILKMRLLVILENLPSFILAAVTGVIVAGWLIKSIPYIAGDNFPMIESMSIDAIVIAVALLIVLMLNVLFSMVALLDINKTALNDNLNSSGKGIQAQSNQAISRGLMILQLAIASILLTASVMLAMQAYKTVYRELGFTIENLHQIRAEVIDQAWLEKVQTYDSYQTSEIKAFRDQIGNDIESLVTNSELIIAGEGAISNTISISVFTDELEPDRQIMYETRALSPKFFEAFQIPFLAGANVTQEQIQQNEKRVVIDETFARVLYPELPLEEIVGKEAKFMSEGVIINGIVPTTINQPNLANHFPVAYLTSIGVGRELTFIVKLPEGQEIAKDELNQKLQELYPKLDNFEVKSLNEVWQDLTKDKRISLAVVLTMTALTLLLAAIGVAGLTQMTTNHRKYELAVRMATGAKQRSLVALILKDAVLMLALGLGVGFILSVFGYEYIQQQLSMLPSFDWLALAILDVGLLSIVVLSVLLPTWQVIKHDPMQALREE